jgi:hypothetical protein
VEERSGTDSSNSPDWVWNHAIPVEVQTSTHAPGLAQRAAACESVGSSAPSNTAATASHVVNVRGVRRVSMSRL